MIRRIPIVLAFLLTTASSGAAQQHPLQISRMDYPLQNIHTLREDNRGFIWAGTSSGVFRIERNRVYRVEPRIGMDSPSASQDFTVDQDGNLWMASVEGLWFHNVRTDETRLLNPGTGYPEILNVFFNSKGDMWVGTRDGAARFESDGDEFVRYEFDIDNPAGIAGSSIGIIAEDHLGDMWFGSWLGGGLSRLEEDSGTFDNYPNFKPSFPVELFDAIGDRIDQSVAGFRSVGANLDLRDTLRLEQPGTYLVASTYETLSGDSDDVGWIETSDGRVVWDVTTAECAHAGGAIKNNLCAGLLTLGPGEYHIRYDSDPIHSFDSWNAVPPPNPTWWGISVMSIDRLEMERLRPLLVRRERRRHTVPGNTLDIERHGSDLWVATGFNVMRRLGDAADFEYVDLTGSAGYAVDIEFDGSSAFVLTQDPDSIMVLDAETGRIQDGISLNGLGFTDMLVARSGDIWLASPREGVFVVRRGTRPFQFTSGPPCLPDCPVELSARDGSNWSATDTGVSRTVGGETVHYREDPLDLRALRGSEVSDIVETDGGSVWIATSDLNWDGGINRFNSVDFDVFRYDPADTLGLSSSQPTDLLVASDGRMWVSHWGGVDEIRSDGALFVGHASPRRNVVTHLAEDSDGFLWMADDGGGLMRMHPDSVAMKVVSDGSGIFWRRTTAIAADPQHGIWRSVRGLGLQYVASDGRSRLFGAEDGIEHLDFVARPLPDVGPDRLRFATEGGWLEVAIASSTAGGGSDLYVVDRTVDDVPMSEDDTWVFPPGSGLAIFRLTSPDYFGTNTLEYRIPELSPEWLETRAWMENRLTGLAPGRYELEGRTVDVRTGVAVSTVSLSIHVMQVLLKRTWFLVLTIVLAVGLVGLIGAFVRRNALEILRTRQRIASDLHDDVGSKVAGIKIMAEMAEHSSSIDADAGYELERIRTTAAEVIDALKEIVWFTDPDPKTDEHLLLRMRHVAEQLLAGMDVDFRADPEVLSSVSLSIKRELMLIFREAVRNVADHSGARHVFIRLVRTSDGIRLVVEDDGCGIKDEDEANGYGLLSIRRRAKRIGGTLTIESSGDTGTRISLLIRE